MRMPETADQIAATTRMLSELHTRHRRATTLAAKDAVTQLQEAIAKLTRLESKLRRQPSRVQGS
jgi:hypothetical protein